MVIYLHLLFLNFWHKYVIDTMVNIQHDLAIRHAIGKPEYVPRLNEWMNVLW